MESSSQERVEELLPALRNSVHTIASADKFHNEQEEKYIYRTFHGDRFYSRLDHIKVDHEIFARGLEHLERLMEQVEEDSFLFFDGHVDVFSKFLLAKMKHHIHEEEFRFYPLLLKTTLKGSRTFRL